MAKTYVPDRDDLVWVDFTPQAGHEQAGRRPALVISPAAYNQKTGLMLAFPVTSHVKGYPFEVLLPAGLRIQGVVLSDHIKNMDWNVRRAEFICKVPTAVTDEVLAKLETLIGAP